MPDFTHVLKLFIVNLCQLFLSSFRRKLLQAQPDMLITHLPELSDNADAWQLPVVQSKCSLLRLIQHLQPCLQVFKSEATFKHSLAWTWFNTSFAPTEQTLSVKDLDHSKSLSAGSLSPCMYTFWTRWLKVSLTWSLQACACRGQPPGCHWTPQRLPISIAYQPTLFLLCLYLMAASRDMKHKRCCCLGLVTGCTLHIVDASCVPLAANHQLPTKTSAHQLLPPCMHSLCVPCDLSSHPRPVW